MAEATTKTKWAALTKPFADDEIELLPKPLKKDAPKSKCAECGGYHRQPAVHLSYVGHAGLTMRLNEVVGPEGWDLEPMGFTEHGTPAMSDHGMWCRLTILGVTKMCFGDAQGKTGANATKEIIGDALRNGAMRFGIGTYLWGKSDKAKAELTRMGMDDGERDASSWQSKNKPASEAQIKAVWAKSKAIGLTKIGEVVEKVGKHPDELSFEEAKAALDMLQAEADNPPPSEDLSQEQEWPGEA